MNEEEFANLWNGISNWIMDNIMTTDSQIQFVIILLSLAVGYVARRTIITTLMKAREKYIKFPATTRVIESLLPIVFPAIWLIIQFVALSAMQGLGETTYLLRIMCSLLAAWIIIHITTNLLQNNIWAKLVALCSWSIAALNIVGLLEPTVSFLNSLQFTMGDTTISMLGIVKGLVAGIITFWIALGLSRFFESKIHKTNALTPSVQVLMSTVVRISLIAVALMIVLSNSGINIAAFAIFGSALGIGIGFGLQKIVSNMVSGVILLLDKSIKPGDVIEVGQTYGKLHSMGARYASVITRDGTEFLIPNEDLITQQVVNWSFSSKDVRIRVPIGISYDSDVHQAIALIVEAANGVKRVLKHPVVKCQMTGFGDNAINLELRFWIADPEDGCGSVKSEILLSIWDKFKENGVSVPFPQRDIRVEMIGKKRRQP